MRGVLFSLGALLLFSADAAGEIYRWVDKEGKLHFSDRPPHVETEKVGLFLNDGIEPLRPGPRPKGERPRKKEKKRKIRAGDYQINFSASQRGNELAVSGRIGNGPECPNLKVSVRLQDEKGTRKTVTAVVSNVGYGRSDLIDARARVSSGDFRNDWTITDIAVDCRP